MALLQQAVQGPDAAVRNAAGELRAKYGVGLQGHLGQFLAMLAQCHVSPDYPIHVGNHEFTINDLIEAEKKTCYPKTELTFKLIALQHYIDLNDNVGERPGRRVGLSAVDPRRTGPADSRGGLRRHAPVVGLEPGGEGPACGAASRSTANTRRPAEFVKKYQQYAFRLQNRDGSLSTSWFRGSGDEDDINRRIKTTGHILEWLCYSLSDEELREPQTIRAVTYLANLMYSQLRQRVGSRAAEPRDARALAVRSARVPAVRQGRRGGRRIGRRRRTWRRRTRAEQVRSVASLVIGQARA